MKRLLLASALALGLASPQVHAASSPPYSVNVPSAPSTTVTCTAASGFTLAGNVFTDGAAPLAAGTLVCTPVVTPTGWAGTLTLTGADAGLFVLTTANPPTVNVGNTALPARGTPYVFGPIVATP